MNYDPENKDVVDWVKSKTKGWPNAGWDSYVLNGKNDDIIFNYANDKECSHRTFFVHTLYYLVGVYYIGNKNNLNFKERIENFLSKVDKSSTDDIKNWKDKAVQLLNDKIYFDVDFWLHHMFREDIQMLNLNDLNNIYNQLRKHRHDLDRWLYENYEEPHDKRIYSGEFDASYNKWGKISETIKVIFDGNLVQSLNEEAIDHLLFFISRNSDLGWFIYWMATDKIDLSTTGNLSEDDFLFLCNESLKRPEDYSDWQLASCFKKFNVLKSEYEKILIKFFERKKDSYTPRRALDALAKLGYSKIDRLVDKFWSVEDEFCKLTCLYSLKESGKFPDKFTSLLSQFKKLYDVNSKDYLKEHIKRLETSDSAV